MEKKTAQAVQEQTTDTQELVEVRQATQAAAEKAAKKEKIKKIGIFAGIGTALLGAGVLIGKAIFGGPDITMEPIVTDFVDDNSEEE